MIDFPIKDKIIPVITLKSEKESEYLFNVISEAGLNNAEITLRNDLYLKGFKSACKIAGLVVGAGSIIDIDKCEKAIDAGAEFIVSPGISEKIYNMCLKKNIFYLPGCATPSEIMYAIDLGINIVKFFPAEAFGGIKSLNAYASVYPKIKFIPTGGINANNVKDYLGVNNVISVGLSSLIKDDKESTRKEIENILKLI